VLLTIAARAESLRWSRDLISLAVKELGSGETLFELLGLQRISPSRYPQAIAVSIVLRHSWRSRRSCAYRDKA
jgi:hypothetical protein